MIRTCLKTVGNSPIRWSKQISTSAGCFKDVDKAIKQNEPAIIESKELLEQREIQGQSRGMISISKPAVISTVSGIPPEIIKDRRVRIFQPAKNTMQSGTNNIGHWEIEFNPQQRWENPLMGWCSTGDPVSNIRIQFANSNEAVSWCEKNGLKWYIQESKTAKPDRVKSYGINFSWNKRTRVSTK